MNVLVVDDDPVSLMVLEAALLDYGHSVSRASNGLEAWQLLLRDPPQVLIVDWMMPQMDGLELTQLVRQHDTRRYTYIVLLTSRGEKEDRMLGMQAGADDFLVKPLDRGELAARLAVADRILRVEDQLRQANSDLAAARQHELQIGAEIQRVLLTGQVPKATSHFQFSALSIPSRHIDGDFYDVFVHKPSVVDVAVGDAMGKGIPAALVGAGTKNAILRSIGSLVMRGESLPPPEEIVQQAHDEVAGRLIRLGSFVTLAYARFDAIGKTLTLVDCGHTKVVRWSKQREAFDILEGPGNFPMGFLEHEKYSSVAVPIEDGDIFVFYSDGVTEATSPSGELFGVDRMLEVLRSGVDLPIRLQLVRLRHAVYRHTAHKPLTDDMTCLIVRLGDVDMPWETAHQVFESDLGELEAVREFVEALAAECGIEGKPSQQLQLAVHEAGTNIVRHAHGESPGATITCAFTKIPKGVHVELSYEGPPFDPPPEVNPDLDNLKGHGLGLFLIRENVDVVRYEHDGICNRVTMEKWFES